MLSFVRSRHALALGLLAAWRGTRARAAVRRSKTMEAEVTGEEAGG